MKESLKAAADSLLFFALSAAASEVDLIVILKRKQKDYFSCVNY